MKNPDKMFMDIAEATATQSNCVTDQIGVVVVRDERVVLQGYNGTPTGFVNCSDKFSHRDMSVGSKHRIDHGKWSKAIEVHAEMNAICYAAKKGIPLEGSILYITHKPCNNCLKHIVSAGIKKVFYLNEYVDSNPQIDASRLYERIELEQYINQNSST